MTSIWLPLALVAILFLVKVFIHKKKLPPGPRGLPLVGNLHMIGENLHQDLYKIAQKYGPIMTIHFGLVPTIVASSPHAAQLFLKTHDQIFASRPYHAACHYIFYNQRNLIMGKYGPYWRHMRKLCTLKLLSNVKINSFQSMRKQELQILVNSLDKAASNRDVVDLSAKLASLSTNMACLMVIGKKYEGSFKDIVQETSHMAATPNLAELFPFLRFIDFQGSTRRMKQVAKSCDEFLENVIDEHVCQYTSDQTMKTNTDMVDTLMEIMQSGEAEFEFDRRHVKAILLDLLVASMDTSSTSIEWILSELFRHPNVMKKLQNELEHVVGQKEMIEEKDLENLDYLNMVIKESFRLHPVAPLLLPHESVEDCTVDGFHIPKESRVLVNVWAIGRDPNVWHDPEKYIPERFIDGTIDLRGKKFQLLPFGSGRRSCPGLQLALTIVRLVVAQLVHSFDWELPNGMMPNDIDMTEKFGSVTSRAQSLMTIPINRFRTK